MNIKPISSNALAEQFIQTNLYSESTLESVLAYVIHTNGSGSRSCVTQHKINDGKLGLGNVVSLKKLSETIASIERKSVNSLSKPIDMFIDANVIAQSSSLLAWHMPRNKKTLFFSESSITVTLPPLLYVYRPAMDNSAASLSVFALAANKRPTRTAKLYHAPLMNVYESGKVCLGTMSLPQQITDTTMDLVMREFFGSRFTHANNTEILRKHSNLMGFYSEKERKNERIMTSDLMPTGLTVSSIV